MRTRADILRDTESFIAGGGRIEEIPIGKIKKTEEAKLGINYRTAKARGLAKIKGRKGTRNTKQQFHLGE